MDRLLLIDDDLELTELLTEFLSGEGFAIEIANDGETGAKKAVEGSFALIVLDVMLPGLNGFEVLRRIRAANRTPVLMLTARGDDVDRIVGLELGADDYLPKPFNPRELVARIRAILRRANPDPTPEPARPECLTVADVVLDFGTRTVRRNGELIELTGVEFDLLAMLLREAGRIVSREELAKKVLGREFSPFDRSIDMHVSNLRRKLGHELNGIERLKAVRGAGYIYAAI
ncbi:MAG: response regulator transcription factor [Acidobacteriota bacterium]|nr:response regulator transcription factor [Acidobacteriota bacterium]